MPTSAVEVATAIDVANPTAKRKSVLAAMMPPTGAGRRGLEVDLPLRHRLGHANLLVSPTRVKVPYRPATDRPTTVEETVGDRFGADGRYLLVRRVRYLQAWPRHGTWIEGAGMTRSESAYGASWVRPVSGVRVLDRGAWREAEGTRSKNPMPRPHPVP